MPSLTILIPGDLTTRTGGYEYDRRIIAELRDLGWAVNVRLLDGSFPEPTPAALADADAALRAAPEGELVMIDGLALGAMPEQAAAHAHRLRLVALVHHPLALETGIAPARADRLRETERQALAAVRGTVVTSRQTVSALAEYGVGERSVSVVEPGTDAAPLARGSGGPAVHLICVASLSPRKGHPVLFRALGRLRDADWRLVCAGSAGRETAYAESLQRLLDDEIISDRVELAGDADAARMAALYDRSDVFVLPTFYEGYGMAVAEALARGLPVISTPTGAIADLVTPDRGLLVAAGDVDGWVAALSEVFAPEVRQRLAGGARAARASLRDWTAAAAEMAAVLESHG